MLYQVAQIHRLPYFICRFFFFPQKSPMISGSLAERNLQGTQGKDEQDALFLVDRFPPKS